MKIGRALENKQMQILHFVQDDSVSTRKREYDFQVTW